MEKIDDVVGVGIKTKCDATEWGPKVPVAVFMAGTLELLKRQQRLEWLELGVE